MLNDLQRGTSGRKPLSAKTVKDIYGILHRALGQAVEVGYLRKKEERKDRLHQNYLRRKANGKQKEWEERYNAKRKAQVEAAKATIRAENMEKGIFTTVSQLPRQEPRKATVSASATV